MKLNPRILVSAHFISSMGEWIQRICLTIYIMKTTGNLQYISFYFISITVADIIIAPLLGNYIDLSSKRKILIYSELLQGLLTLILIFYRELWLIFLLTFICSLIKNAGNITQKTVIPLVVDKTETIKVNSNISIANAIVRVSSAVFSATLVMIGITNLFFILNALSFFVAAFLYSHLKFSDYNELTEIVRNERIDIKSALTNTIKSFKLFTQHQIVVVLTIISSITFFLSTAVNILIVDFISSITNNGSMYAIYMFVLGLGLILGSFLIRKSKREFNIRHLLMLVLIDGFLLILMGTSDIKLVILMGFFIGIVSSFFNIINDSSLQRVCPPESIGRLISINYAIIDISYLASMIIIGIIASQLSTVHIIYYSGFAMVITAGLGFILIRMIKESNLKLGLKNN